MLLLFYVIYCKNMSVNSIFLKYGLLMLFLLLRVLAYRTENHDLYTNPITSNVIENNTIGEFNATTVTGEAPSDNYSVGVNGLKIISISPTEVVVDATTDLQLSIASDTVTNIPPIFCFLSTPDNDLEVLSSYWISDTQLNCTGFSPTIPGLFSVTTDFPNLNMTFNKMATVKVISKHPVAEQVEYSHNFDKMFIYFDGNIELQSNCANVFSEKSLEYFGTGFTCAVMGNALIVKLGVNFKITKVVEISAGNKICRSGSTEEFCFTAKSGNVAVKAPKVAHPTLSLLTTSECRGNISEKYVSLQVSSHYENQNSDEVSLSYHSGKNQRKNLIIWRTLKRIQNKLWSNLTLKIDKSSMEPLYQNLASVENFLENETKQLGSWRSGVTVSIYVKSSVGTILAEANVVFCKNFSQLFHYKWIVNDRIVREDDKLILLQDVTPGMYLIKCNIVAYNSSEILGQGWTTTEVFDSRPKVIIYPVEIVTAATEDVSLHAVVWQGGKISWSCRTKVDKVCLTNSQQLISDVLDMTSPNISIPAGILPAGEFLWTIENSQGVNKAKIIIKLENKVSINVKLGSVFVEPSQKVILQGIVKGLENGCRLWWSSVRQKGFNNINLQRVRSSSEVLIREGKTEQEIDFIFPPSPENWKALEPDSLYMFKLQAFCPRSMLFEYIKIPISVNNPPRISSIKVEPKKGLAMTTNFIISKVQAHDSLEDYPLLFEWSYIDTCGVEIPITRGAYSRQVTTFLPPGDIKIMLTVCDVKKACAKVSSSIIDVSHSQIIPENFHNAANLIYYLIVGPDYLEAFGLATTVFKSLALKAETEIRRSVFRSVVEGIYTRIRQFNESMEATSKSVKSCLDFVDRALKVARYFPKSSDINKCLTDFKHNLLNNAAKKHTT